jgi:hypothetical protein
VTLVGDKCQKIVEAEENRSNDFTAFLAGNTPDRNGQSKPSTVKKQTRPRKTAAKKEESKAESQKVPDTKFV